MQMVEASEQAAHGLEHAMRLMKDAGFEIRHPVRVVVDPNLPFMGYTMPEENSFKIVTSRMATSSEMLEGLLTHELSHIYRMQTNHPSHNEEIITAAVNKLGKRNLAPEYKMKIIRDLINDLEDLYADDVAVKVMTENGVISKDQLAEFFQSWVKGEPVRSRFAERDGWVNASIMAKNARAISQMIRHGIVDRNGKARTRNHKFLSQIASNKARHFDYLRDVLTNLKEDVTRATYAGFLDDYLPRLIEIAHVPDAE